MNIPRPRTVATGLVYAAGTPVILACLAGTTFVGGNLVGSLFAWLFGTLVALPVTTATVFVFGVPIYLLYRRLNVVSLPAYAAAGFLVSAAVTGAELWLEYTGGYEDGGEALLEHAAQLVTLISGPAAAAVFWRTVRPDLRRDEVPTSSGITTARSMSRFRRAAVAIVLVATVAFVSYRTFAPDKRVHMRNPLMSVGLDFDSTKTPDLVAYLKSYATAHSAHLGYYFMPTRPPGDFPGLMPPVLLMANIEFADGISVTVTNAGSNVLQAFIYSDTNKANDQTAQVWSDFIAFLRSAVDHANGVLPDQLPDLPWHGEGGKLESKWWDWRFRRQ
jgi:hypothetical protein